MPQSIKPSMFLFFPSCSSRQEISPNLHMFTEDITLGIMPIGGRSTQKGFSIDIRGEEEDCKIAIKVLGSIGEYDRYDAVDTVCSAVEYIAAYLVDTGKAVFEIVMDDGFAHVHGVAAQHVFNLGFSFLQVVPPADWAFCKKKCVFVGRSRMLTVRMPKSLGGVVGFRCVLKGLKKYNGVGPRFYLRNIEREGFSHNFDFSTYMRMQKIYMNKVTSTWGWNGRDMTQEICTEYYTLDKLLSFRRAQAVLREHILDEINKFLNRLSLKCQVLVKGLPTPGDIDAIKRDMRDGNISFTEAMDRVRI